MEVWLSMFRQILILSAIVFLIAILSIHAEVTFIPDAEIALPDSFFIDDNTTFEFKDLNNDYVEEIIIENESIIASYSLKENRTIDYFIKPVDTILHDTRGDISTMTVCSILLKYSSLPNPGSIYVRIHIRIFTDRRH